MLVDNEASSVAPGVQVDLSVPYLDAIAKLKNERVLPEYNATPPPPREQENVLSFVLFSNSMRHCP